MFLDIIINNGIPAFKRTSKTKLEYLSQNIEFIVKDAS